MRRGVRWAAAVLVAAACSPTSETWTPPAPANTSPEPEPAPEFHPHPEIPPDELGDASVPDASAATYAGCTSLPSPPPLAAAPAARIRSGPPITNHIPPEIVMRPIRQRAGCFRACFAEARQRTAAAGGRVAVQFVIDADGWVRTAHVREDATGDPALAACVARQFVGLQYPTPDGGRITVVYPVTFDAGDAAP
jgi:TonB family protein